MTPAAFDAREPAADAALGDLPEWDLADLYAGPDAPEIARDTDWLARRVPRLRRRLRGQARRARRRRAAGGDPALRAHPDRVRPDHELRRACATRRTPPTRCAAKFYGDRQAELTDASAPLVFFTLELNRIDDAALDALLAADPELARYKPVLDRVRAMKPYQLSDELERFLHDQSVVGASAWNRLFDETLAGLEFERRRRDPDASRRRSTSSPTPTGRGARPAPRRWRWSSRRGCRSSRA